MQPRVLFRTHYQVDEPALMEYLVKRCTSAVSSAYSETVAMKLAKEVQSLGKPFNIPAGRYALDLAHGLGLVNEQNVWTDKGHLVSLKAEIVDGSWEDQLALRAQEKVLHLRLFLEADGAALLYIARYMLENRRMPDADEDWNSLARELFIQIDSECLGLAATTADRVALRTEVDRIRSHGYKGKSGSHKMFIHLQTLFRLGLVERAPTAAARQYVLDDGGGGRGLRTLVDEVRDLYELEAIVRERRALEVSAKILQLEEHNQHPKIDPEEFLRLIIRGYREVMATGTPLAPLTTLIEFAQIEVLISAGCLVPYNTALGVLEHAQQKRPSDLRFHVDRRGLPAFLKLSDKLVGSYL
jgi:hypothetical protein